MSPRLRPGPPGGPASPLTVVAVVAPHGLGHGAAARAPSLALPCGSAGAVAPLSLSRSLPPSLPSFPPAPGGLFIDRRGFAPSPEGWAGGGRRREAARRAGVRGGGQRRGGQRHFLHPCRRQRDAGGSRRLPSSPSRGARLSPPSPGSGKEGAAPPRGPEESGRAGTGAEPAAEMAGAPRSPHGGSWGRARVEERLRGERSCCANSGSQPEGRAEPQPGPACVVPPRLQAA